MKGDYGDASVSCLEAVLECLEIFETGRQGQTRPYWFFLWNLWDSVGIRETPGTKGWWDCGFWLIGLIFVEPRLLWTRGGVFKSVDFQLDDGRLLKVIEV